MEAKKNPNVDLKRTSQLFLVVGLIISLLGVITAFEWRFYEKAIVLSGPPEGDFEDMEEIPITEVLPPPPPVAVMPEVEEAEEDEEIEDPPEIIMDEPDEVVEIIVPVDEPEEEVIEEPVIFAEQTATPRGGMTAFQNYLKTYLSKNYPERAKKAGIQGKVFVTFIVEKDGSVSNIRVLKGIGGGCDEAAVDAIRKFGKWNPAKQRGRPVRLVMNLPITFRLAS